MKISKATSDLVLVLPDTFDKTKTYPLIIFAHGVGAQWGIDALIGGELPIEIQKAADDFNYIVLAPWTSGDWQLSHFDKTVAYAKVNLPIDWNRFYLMALSLGGQFISKAMSTDRANQVAAFVVACGVNSWSTGQYVKSAGVPGVFFHAVDDPTVAISSSRNAVKLINDTNPPVPAKIVEYPDGGHYIWSRAFSNTNRPWLGLETPPTIYDWLFMNTVDTPVAVPVATSPSGMIPVLNITEANGLITLNGKQSAGYQSAQLSVISVPTGEIKYNYNIKDAGTDTGTLQLTKPGAYTFRLTTYPLKDYKGTPATKDVVYDFKGAAVVKTPVKYEEVNQTLIFSDGSSEPYSSLTNDLATGKKTFKTASNSYTV